LAAGGAALPACAASAVDPERPGGNSRGILAAMLSFILRRLAQAVLVMLVVGMGAFWLFRYVGDPVGNMLGQDAAAAQRAQLHADLGLDKPAAVQFLHFLGHAVTGDFGLSLRQGREVSALIAERLPATVELAVVAALIALAAGIPLGVYAALRREHWDAKLTMALSLLGISLPTFLIGIGLIELFSVLLGWFPSYGRGTTIQLGSWRTGLLTVDGWRHIALPAFTLAMYQLALLMRLVRAEMLEALRSDYVKFARARGLPDRVVHFGHALRNTLVPVLTISGLQLGSLIAFSIITETVFSWPGMGSLFIQAVQFPDVPVMAAYLCLIALVFVTINLGVDVLYAVVDPRLRVQASAPEAHR
jgi:peptide/nickel transport system permease protein